MFNYLVLLSELALLAQAATYKSLSHTAYAALQNPARGPLGHQECHLSKQDWFTDSDLQYSVDQGQVMHNIVFYLDNHVDGSAITDAELTALDKQFALYRQKGLKGAFRFAYTLDVPPAVTEPDLAGIQKHTQQLKALLAKYQDVVYSLQQGWIGTWGEQYYSTHFGAEDPATYTTADWEGRNAVAQASYDITPEGSYVELRREDIKQKFMGSSAVSVNTSTASTSAKGARVGVFDDCVFGGYDKATPYTIEASPYVPRGGEVCGTSTSPAEYACSLALSTLAAEHWTYLNIENGGTIKAAWQSEGCLDEIVGRLGYRLQLSDADLQPSGWNSLTVKNTGFAAPMQKFKVQAILVPKNAVMETTDSVQGYVAELDYDVRRWAAGGQQSLPKISFSAKDASALGSGLEVFLAISDNTGSASAPTLSRPEFRIVFGTDGVQSGPAWVKTSRLNRLNHTITSFASGGKALNKTTLRFTNDTLTW